MKMVISKSFCLISMLLIISENFPSSSGLPGIGDIQTISNFANDAIGILKGDLPISALFTGSTGPTMDKILDAVSGISKQLDDFGDQFRAQLDAHAERVDKRFDEINAKLDEILTEFPLQGKAFSMTRELHTYMARVDELYAKYERYSMGRNTFNNYTIKKFIATVTSDRRGDLDNTLYGMFSLLIPERSSKVTEGIFDVLAEQMALSANSVCGSQNSAQMTLFQIYQSIIITETRGFIMSIFAYSLLAIFERSPFDAELDFLRDQLVTRSAHYLKITAKTMKGLPRTIELCDAPHYAEGINYVKLNKPNQYMDDGSFITVGLHMADIQNNMVVSGIRFVKKFGNMIEFEIQEARLLPQGAIDNRNQTWIVASQPISDGFRETNNRRAGVPTNKDRPARGYKNYVAVQKRLRNKVLMNYLMLPRNYILAGVGFRSHYKGISLRICGVKFNFTTGELTPDNVTCKQADDDDIQWSKVTSGSIKKNPPDATRNYVDTKPNDVVVIQSTTDGTDLIVPFFDSRPVDMGTMSFALTGVGLYHRGTLDYGGYFNFRLYTIDLSEYVVF